MFDPSSRREVLTVDQPYSNHNGGQLAFGPDQLLYIGLGDGGSGGDPQRNALDLGSRLGKILRIDPVASGDQPYTVPADNPFVDTAGADPTVWAYGLRNPWRFSFDAPTGDLWIADVGQGDWEEVNRARATAERMDAGRGANFGWSAIEGFEPFNDDQPSDGALDPLFVYDHNDGRCSVSGGAVARGDAVAALQGWYVFGDYCTGQIWALDPTVPPSQPRVIEIARLDGLAAISQGPDADLYAVSNAGPVARIIPPPLPQEAEEVGEGLLGVDVETTMLEPPTDVQHVAVQEIETLHVGGDVDRLREVDEPEAPLPPQQVVRRQVAVGDARRGDPAEAHDQLPEGVIELVARQPGGRQRRGGRLPTPDVLEIEHLVGIADRIRHRHSLSPEAQHHLVFGPGPAVLQEALAVGRHPLDRSTVS